MNSELHKNALRYLKGRVITRMENIGNGIVVLYVGVVKIYVDKDFIQKYLDFGVYNGLAKIRTNI